MSFTWSDFAAVSDEMLTFSKSSTYKEAYFRTIISRAYYAALISCRNELIRKDHIIPPTAVHQKVPEILEKYNYSASKALYRLKSDRKKADYEDQIPGNNYAKTAESSLIMCKQILSCLPLK